MKNFLKKFIGVVVGLFVVYTFYYIWAQSQPKPDIYELLTPQNRTIEETSIATGQIEAKNQVNVKPRMTGILSDLSVQVGQQVNVGDVIARITVIPDMNALNNAKSAVKRCELNLEETSRETDRIVALYGDGVVSKEEYERAVNKLALAKEELKKAKSEEEIILRGTSSTVGAVNTTLVKATMQGTVIDLPLKQGASVVSTNSFTDGTTIATIADLSSLRFTGKIDEIEVEQIHPGMPMKLTIGAIRNKTFEGQLEEIATKGIKDNGTIMFEVSGSIKCDENFSIRREGYSANASIVTNKAQNTLSIEEAALEHKDGKKYVYKLVSNKEDIKNQKFERVEVETGISDGIHLQILNGVTSSDIIRGNQQN